MSDYNGLKIIDGATLSDRHKEVYRPGAPFVTSDGREVKHPRYFFEVPSKEVAQNTRLSSHFDLWEFMYVDMREHPLALEYPRYVPCAVSLLASQLEVFRSRFDKYVHIAANGGYRSPSHELVQQGSPHAWGTAANIYKIGDTMLDRQETIDQFAEIVRRTLPASFARSFGRTPGSTIDHLHIDIGYSLFRPRDEQLQAAANV